MTDREIFRPRSGIGLSIGVAAIAGLSLGSLITSGRTDLLPGGLCLAVAGSCVTWVVMLRPKVEFSETELVIVNPLRTIEVPWNRVDSIDNKYSLNVSTESGRFNAWAAVAPSRYQARRVHATDIKHTALEGRAAIRAADSPNSETGTAMLLAQHFMASFDANANADKTRKVKVSTSKTSVGLLVAAIASLLIGVIQHWL